jgi:hypothetical protein
MEETGKRLNTQEKYHTLQISKKGLHKNDSRMDACNPIFEAVQEVSTR